MNQRKLRIGIITHNYPTTSKERKDAGIFIYDFAEELSKKAEVFVLCPDFGGKKENYKEVPVTWFGWGGGSEKFGNWKLYNPLHLWRFLKLIFNGSYMARKFVDDNAIDICLACWALPSSIFAWWAKKTIGVQYASWSLGSDVNKYTNYPILGTIIKKVITDADLRFANSYLLLDKVKQISGKDCKFLPAITNINVSAPKVKLPKNKYNFLFVGRLEKVKGPDLLIEACNLLVKTETDFTVNILGGGSMDGQLKDVSSKVLSKNVYFQGWADEKKVAGFMKSSDCLVISSRSESLPLVLLEAAKFALPVISTDVGDCKRIIEKYKIGLVSRKDSAENLSHQMSLMMRDYKKIIKKSTRGFANLSKDFSQEITAKNFLQEVNKV